MRALVQRVRRAEVRVLARPSGSGPEDPGEVTGQIGRGMVVLLGVAPADGPEDAGALAGPLLHLRTFGQMAARLNRSLLDTGGEVLRASQRTLSGDACGGRG